LRSSDTILNCDGVRKAFGGVTAVDVDHVEIERQSITALIGPNGAGKTTFFDIITGFLAPDSGAIDFDGTDISSKPPYAIARSGLVRTFQLTRILGKMTVLENMLLAAPGQSGEYVHNAFFGRGKIARQEAANREKAVELLDRFSLTPLTNEYAGRLSGGQRKLLELARTLMTDPTLVLLDEPMAGVNPRLGEQLLRYVLDLREDGMTFLFVEHDMDIVMRISDRVLVMATGAVIADGSPDEVRKDPAVLAAYLGEHAEEDLAAAEEDTGPPTEAEDDPAVDEGIEP
jgi:neutral amino acid transport system ATP-binding protein